MEAQAGYCRRGGVGTSRLRSDLGVTVCFLIKQSLQGRGCGRRSLRRLIKQVMGAGLQQWPAKDPLIPAAAQSVHFSGAACPINGAFEEAALVTAGPSLQHPLGHWTLKADCPFSSPSLLRHSSR